MYERVSTTRQAEEGYSLDGQLHELRERLSAEGRRIVAEVTDPGEKRWMYDRPGLTRLKELAATGEIDEVWAWAWDRFGEDPWPTLLAIELAEYGVKIRSLDDGGEGEDAEMLRVLKGWMAKRDGGDRPRKSVMGKFSKARKGEIIGSAFRPRYGFGYVRNGKGKAVGYAVDPEKMANVRSIFAMLADGASIHGVAEALEKGGVRPPGWTQEKPRTSWSRATIRSMALDDIYLPRPFEEVAAFVSPEVAATLDPEKVYGVSWFGRHKTSRKSHRSKQRKVEPVTDRSKWIPVPVDITDAGLERGVVEMARSEIGLKRRTVSKDRRFNELLGGIFYCGGCGNRMVADSRRRTPTSERYHYYRCETKHKHGKDACPLPGVYRAEQVEEEVGGFISRMYADPRALVEAMDKLIEQERSRTGDPERTAQAIRGRLADIERRMLNSQSSAMQAILASGDLDPNLLRAQVAQLEDEKRTLERELAACENLGGRVRELEELRDFYAGAFLPDLLENQPEWADHIPNDVWRESFQENVMDLWDEKVSEHKQREFMSKAPQERHRHYRKLGIKVVADPEGGIRIEGDIVKEWLLDGTGQEACVPRERTSS